MTETKKTPLPSPRKIVTYPVGNDEKCGGLYIFGSSDGGSEKTNLILMSAGYPDDQECFLPMADRLAKELPSTVVGVTCLPGYDDREDHPYTANKPEGYSFQEMTLGFREAAKALKQEATNASKASFTGIFHDWGVAPGIMYTNQTLEDDKSLAPDRLVLFDVLMPLHPEEAVKAPVVPKDTILETVTTYSYRIVLASAYAIRRFINSTLAQFTFGLGFTFLSTIGLSPTKSIDGDTMKNRHVPMTLDRIIYMAYPYFQTFRVMFSGMETMKKEFNGCHVPRNLKECPVLYMYGSVKNIHFHDKQAMAYLEKERDEKLSKSNVIEVKDAGHFLYAQQPEICFEAVANFIKDA